MLITITGCEKAPTWETTQALIRQCRNDEKLVLTMIQRTDRLPDYIAVGTYNVKAKHGDGRLVEITMKVDC